MAKRKPMNRELVTKRLVNNFEKAQKLQKQEAKLRDKNLQDLAKLFDEHLQSDPDLVKHVSEFLELYPINDDLISFLKDVKDKYPHPYFVASKSDKTTEHGSSFDLVNQAYTRGYNAALKDQKAKKSNNSSS